jgi:glycosyltransferase involved in cell wall biosynthesis
VYLDSSVVVVPVYNGSGTNIKVIEAMSRGKACVISSFAGKGYEDILVNGKNIFIAESNVDFAEKIVKLLLDDDLRAHIGESARESVDQRYSFENFSEIIIKSIPGLFTETK